MPAHAQNDCPHCDSFHVPLTYIASFSGSDCAGNRHAVAFNQPARSSDYWRALSQQLTPLILVVIDRPTTAGAQAHAQFYHYGQSVAWCGSGILAAAKALQLASFSARSITTAIADYEILNDQGNLGFVAHNGVHWRPARHPGFWRQLFGRAFCHAQETPERRGYTLVELKDEAAVRLWRPKLQSIKRHSLRALIITAKATRSSYADYVLRYFAPQYGNDEDDATGSANVLLIAYWARRLGKSTLRGQQLSARGGLFYGCTSRRNGIALYGNTCVLGGEGATRNAGLPEVAGSG